MHEYTVKVKLGVYGLVETMFGGESKTQDMDYVTINEYITFRSKRLNDKAILEKVRSLIDLSDRSNTVVGDWGFFTRSRLVEGKVKSWKIERVTKEKIDPLYDVQKVER